MEGYKQNALGHLVPIDQIHPIDLARDELVMEKAGKIKAMQEERDHGRCGGFCGHVCRTI